MPLSPGSRLGPYDVVAAIGAGGMGEVYRARDSKLGRDVALKVLPEAFARDAERLARFQREARLLAALNHPNIASIFGLEDSGATHALVMELIEGPTLADRIRRGPIPVEESLRIAKQICDALEYAHERGIVHRDLKPANVKVTGDDAVKVLDFGLAKAIETNPSPSEAMEVDDLIHRMEKLLDGETVASGIRNSPTLSEMATRAGVLLGTAAYMSPEQAKGRAVDRRADIWAFGCVLYEMLTGRMAFEGESVTETLAAVMRDDPSWSELPATTPVRVRYLLQRCLQKDSRQRLRDIGEARIALEEAIDGVPGTADAQETDVAAQSRMPWKSAWIWAAGAAIAVVFALAGLVGRVSFERANAPPRVVRIEPLTHDGRVKGNEVGPTPLVTEGERIYFTELVGVVPLLSQVSSSGGETLTAPAPFAQIYPTSISADGSSLLMGGTAAYAQAMPFYAVELLGGTPRRLDDFAAQDAAWSRDGKQLVYAVGRDLYLASSDGSSGRKLTSADGTIFWPRISPSGDVIRFGTGFFKENSKLWEVGADGTGLREVAANVPDACCGDWSPDGKEFYFQGLADGLSSIWALTEGDSKPVQLTSGPLSFRTPAVSPDGKKIFVVGEEQRGQLMKYDAKTSQFVPFIEGISPDYVAFSRDGQWLAYTTLQDGILWRQRLDGSDKLQLTFPPMQATMMNWSPDGTKLAFMAHVPGKPWNIMVVNAGGGGLEKVFPENIMQASPSWSPDGQRLSFDYFPGYIFDQPGQVLGIKTADMHTHQVTSVPGSQGLFGSQWSPDGRYLVAVVPDALGLTMYDSRTTTWKQFTSVEINFETWSRDSQYVYFDTIGADPAFYRAHVPDLKVERLFGLKGHRRPFGFIGVFSGIAPDGSVLIVDDVGWHEIYSLDLSPR